MDLLVHIPCLIHWSTCTLKKHPRHRHRPHTKTKKVRNDSNLSLVINRGLVENWKKHSHQLSTNSHVLYSTVNGQVASNEVNISDVVLFGEKM